MVRRTRRRPLSATAALQPFCQVFHHCRSSGVQPDAGIHVRQPPPRQSDPHLVRHLIFFPRCTLTFFLFLKKPPIRWEGAGKGHSRFRLIRPAAIRTASPFPALARKRVVAISSSLWMMTLRIHTVCLANALLQSSGIRISRAECIYPTHPMLTRTHAPAVVYGVLSWRDRLGGMVLCGISTRVQYLY